MLADIRTYLTDQTDRLRALHEAGAMETCKFGIDWSAAGRQERLDRACHMRDAARLLALEAIERAVSGKPDEAMEALCAGLRVAHALRGEPWMTPALVGIACEGIALRYLEWVLARARPSPAALRRLEKALGQELEPGWLERALLAHRCLVLNDRQEHWGPRPPALPPAPRACKLTDLVQRLLNRPLAGDPPSPAEKLHYLDMLDACLAAAREPYPRSSLSARAVAKAYARKAPKHRVLTSCDPAILGRFIFQVQAATARLESARTALAVLRYKAEHSGLPDGLRDLVPGFVDAVSSDPFNGEPLLYRKEKAGFVVYSVGENGKDDGGKTSAARHRGPDEVFRVRWPKDER
jgi:hypothetical protein